jgi:hypothetical protein
VRQVAGEPEQLELERERERLKLVGRRPRRQLVQQVEKAGQRLEGARARLLLRVEAKHRLGADQPDAEPVRVFAGRVMRADELDPRDRLQLPLPTWSRSSTWESGSSRAP